jgi:polysaccharide export outer membrane protein
MKYNKLYLTTPFLIGLVALLLSSCSFRNRQALLKTPYDADTVKTVRVINGNLADSEDYYNLIKPEDELAIRNVQDMRLIVRDAQNGNVNAQQTFTTFKVNANGEVVLPKVGNIKVAGLNRTQAAAEIQKAYEAKELNAPLIDVRIANAYIVLLGEVGKQGKYIIDREDYELIDLLADAGGVNINANRKMVRIFRGDRANPEIIQVNLNDYSFIKDPKLKLRAKDIVYVEPRRIASSSQNFQAYSTFIQVGLVAVNTLLLIYNIAK